MYTRECYVCKNEFFYSKGAWCGDRWNCNKCLESEKRYRKAFCMVSVAFMALGGYLLYTFI